MTRALRGRRRSRFAAAAALLLVGAAAVILLSGGLAGDGPPSSPAATNVTATTEVRRQDLVEVETEQGTLGYGDSRDVVNRLPGTLTWLPAAGSVIRPDGVVLRVDGDPVVLFDGPVPAYRDLSSASGDGADVAQLERNLRDLGYDEGEQIALDDSWDAGTTAAVERWQEAHGLEPTGRIDLGTVVFQPGARRVASLDSALGGDAGSGGASPGDASGASEGAALGGAAAQTAFASYSPQVSQQVEDESTDQEAGDRGEEEGSAPVEDEQPDADDPDADDPDSEPMGDAPSDPSPETRGDDPEQRAQQDSQEQAPREPARQGQAPSTETTAAGETPNAGGSAPGSTGSSGGRSDASEAEPPSSTVLTTTSTRPVVTVDLDTSKVELVRRGAEVRVELPSGASSEGRITDVGSVATAPESQDGADATTTSDATIEVTIRLRSSEALDQAPVTVSLERSRRRDALAVPVTALLARAGGRFAVEVREGATRRLVSVEPGLYAGGFVEVAGQGLRPGTVVTDARV